MGWPGGGGAEVAGHAWPRVGDGRRPLRPIVMRQGRSDRHVRHLLDRAGQHADVCRRNAAQPGCCRDQRRGQGESGTSWSSGQPTPGWPRGSGRDAGRGDQPGKRRQRGGLPGQIPRFGRPGHGGENTRQVMHLWRRPGGDRAPIKDHVQQRLVALTAGPAGGEPRHLTMQSVGPAHCVTPARAASSASRRRPRCAATRTAPGVLPTIRATSLESRSATTRSMMISA